jgi:hypothetical protein
MTNQYVKYEDFVITSFQDNQRKTILTFKAPVTLTFYIETQNLQGSSTCYDQSLCEIQRLYDEQFSR